MARPRERRSRPRASAAPPRPFADQDKPLMERLEVRLRAERHEEALRLIHDGLNSSKEAEVSGVLTVELVRALFVGTVRKGIPEKSRDRQFRFQHVGVVAKWLAARVPAEDVIRLRGLTEDGGFLKIAKRHFVLADA